MSRARRHPLLLASALATAVVLALSASAGAQTFSQFGAGTLDRPAGVDVDQLGNVYVADSGNAVIRKYSNTGTLLATFGPAIPPNGCVRRVARPELGAAENWRGSWPA